MTWYYVEAGQQAGPITDEQLNEFAASGRIQPDTLVWREGMPNWQPYREVRPAAVGVPVAAGAPPIAAPAPGTVVCAECGNAVPQDSAVPYGSLWVCAACKPVFFQKVREGLVPGGPGSGNLPADPEELVRLIRERDYSLDIGGCLGRGWELLKSHFGLLVLGTFIWLVMQVIMQLIGLIPLLGALISLVVAGPLMGGFYNFFIKAIRNQSGGVGDVFSGFGPRFLHLMLTTIVQGLLIGAAAVIVILPVLLAGGMQRGEPSPLAIAIVMLILLPAAVYISIAWMFSLPLVMDRGLGFWQAMEVSRRVITMHWWSVFGLMFLCGLLTLAGLLACGIGLLVTAPLAFSAMMYAYDDIFGSGQALGA